MGSTIQPRDAAELTDAIAWALDHATPLAIGAGNSKAGLGHDVAAEHRLDLGRLRGISLYEPEELVLTCGPATSLREIESVLAQRNQMLAFEPPDCTALYGVSDHTIEGGTLGGILAANLSGSRRISAGAARDHFLGFQGTSGRGERFKSGGRVMKNVTGYDLPKLMAGSFGTLAALDEVTVKVLPLPEKSRTVLVLGLDDAAGVATLCRALGEPVEVSGAAHLPAAAAARSSVSYVRDAGTSVTALRLEGPGPSVAERCRHLRELFAASSPTEELHTTNSATLWGELRNLTLVATPAERILWRVSVAPTDGPGVVAAVCAGVSDAFSVYDWSGGLVWLSLPPSANAHEPVVRGALTARGGHATLMRAPADVRARVPVFQPQAAALAALTRRVKESFDPRDILNPGRMG